MNNMELRDVVYGWSDERIAGTKIYLHNCEIVPLRIDCYKDLIPFFPYIASVNESEIVLSSESSIDKEEREMLTTIIISMKRRVKESNVTIDELTAEYDWFGDIHDDYIFELAKRVIAEGDDATVDGIHIPCIDELYREPLYEEMIGAGYSENQAKRWVYGLERTV